MLSYENAELKIKRKTFIIHINYKANVANSSAKKAYLAHGASNVGEAYEIKAVHGAELMRSKYCVRYELGLCHLHPEQLGRRSEKLRHIWGNYKAD